MHVQYFYAEYNYLKNFDCDILTFYTEKVHWDRVSRPKTPRIEHPKFISNISMQFAIERQ